MDLSGTHDFLLTFHSNHGPNCTVSEINGDLSRKLQIFPTSRVFCASTDGIPLGIGYRCKGCYYSGSVLLSLRFITTSGVRQDCVLAPALFCRAIDWIMERVASRTGFSLGNDHFTDLDYADDVVLLAHKMDDPGGFWDNSVATRLTCILAEDEDTESGCGWIYTLPTSLRPLAGRSN